eukprot:Nk52_evm27s2506 gene=Nk52_evmTU27s2506
MKWSVQRIVPLTRVGYGKWTVGAAPQKLLITKQSALLLQKNSKHTFSKQHTLPRLPVPELEQTLEEYKKSIKGLVSPTRYEDSSALVDDFKASNIAHKRCRQEKEHPSWLEEWWDEGYLGYREACAYNVNYYFIGNSDKIPQTVFAENNGKKAWRSYHNAAKRLQAAVYLHCAMQFRYELMHEKIPVQQERNSYLCMSQFPRLFNCSRIPGAKKDALVTYQPWEYGRSQNSKTSEYRNVDLANLKHILFIDTQGNGWFVDVANDDGTPRDWFDIWQDLMKCKHMPEQGDEKQEPFFAKVARFTGVHRDVWHEAYEELCSFDEANRSTLEHIQSACLVVSESDVGPTQGNCTDALFGDTGRWYDKHQWRFHSPSTSTKNGHYAQKFQPSYLWEHASGDGKTSLVLVDYVYKHSTEILKDIIANKPDKLEWYDVSGSNSHNSTVQSVMIKEPTSQRFSELVDICSQMTAEYKKKAFCRTVVIDHMGSNEIKSAGVSPDSFVQLSFQLAYYRALGFCPPTYESALTGKFLHGRTETVRTVSSESKTFVEMFDRISVSVEDKSRFFKEAGQIHQKRMRAAKDGEGIDRHLLGLKTIANTEFPNDDVPFFCSRVFQETSVWALSTSNCGSGSITNFGFGPVCDHGVGIGYNIQPGKIYLSISMNGGPVVPLTHKNNSRLKILSSEHDIAYPEVCDVNWSAVIKRAMVDIRSVLLLAKERRGRGADMQPIN